MAATGGDTAQLATYMNNLGYENFVWKTKYNELWQNFLAAMAENKRLQDELALLQNNPIEATLENNAATGNRISLTQLLQNKNAELVKNLISKNVEVASLQRKLDVHKHKVPNSPPLQPPPK